DITGSLHDSTIHPNPTPADRIVVIAVDATPASKQAFEWAVTNIIRPETDQIILLYLTPKLPQEIEDAVTLIPPVRAFADALPPYKYRVRSIALIGDPREAIVHKSEELNADLVIVGSRNLGRVRKVLLGSVSDHVVRHCRCPVVVARSQVEGAWICFLIFQTNK
ncbi:hypothetical protein BC829DRAFT_380768, partial [Chytridium lagenaria]